MRPRPLPNLALATALLLLAGLPAAAQGGAADTSGEAPSPRPRQLQVGIKEAPPFVMKAADGTWTGISIELWRQVAAELGVRYDFQEHNLEGLLTALEEGTVDAGVGALTVTHDREARMDFSHPFYTTGFGIAVEPLGEPGWDATVKRLVSWGFLGSLGLLVLVLLVVGALVWLVERRANPDFGGGDGLWSGFWWAAVTMTTVGYGDKAPKTVPGRILGLVWMFTAIVLIGTFIANMSSALTVSQLQAPIRSPEDLGNATVATVERSASEAFLRERRIPFRYAEDLQAALAQVAAGDIDAAVYDAPLMRYLATHGFQDQVDVLPQTFGRQDYSIALPTGSPYREDINRILLDDETKALLQDLLFEYLEQEDAPEGEDG